MDRRDLGFKGLRLRRSETGDGRTIEGIAVPFGDVYNDPWDGAETFDRDCEFVDADTAKLCYQHGELIGAIVNAESRDDGLHITARIADTQRGRDAVALLDEGALDSLSVGFIPIESERDKNNVIHRRKVRLLETSLVSWPAYQNAKLTDHRSEHPSTQKGKPMDPTIEDVIARQDEQAELLRKLQVNLSDMAGSQQRHTPGGMFRSFGHMLKTLAAGDEQARGEYEQMMRRDYTGATTADTAPQPVWISKTLRILEQKRRITNLVTHAALPAEGQTLEYPLVTGNTAKVGKQDKEGDYLQYGKITIGTRSVNIETYGGYVSLSRQTIERASIPYLDKALEALVKAYAVNTESATRLALYGAITAVAAGDKIAVGKALTTMTPNDWLDIIIDARLEAETRNTNIDFLGVSGDVFKSIAHLTDDGNRFMDVSGSGVDRLGSIDTTDITGNLLRVPVVLMPGAVAGTAAFLDRESVTVWESGNAPFQLQDENILNLSKDYSVYGYAAHGVTLPEGIMPIKFTA